MMRRVRKTKHFGGVGRSKRKPNKCGMTKFEIAKLEYKPGDTLVLRTDLPLRHADADLLRIRTEANFPGAKIAILSHGLSLAVLSHPPFNEGVG